MHGIDTMNYFDGIAFHTLKYQIKYYELYIQIYTEIELTKTLEGMGEGGIVDMETAEDRTVD